jgi:hypothetical protein
MSAVLCAESSDTQDCLGAPHRPAYSNVPLDVLFILLVRRLTALQLGALSGRVRD